jgi:hypothetical protein
MRRKSKKIIGNELLSDNHEAMFCIFINVLFQYCFYMIELGHGIYSAAPYESFPFLWRCL